MHARQIKHSVLCQKDQKIAVLCSDWLGKSWEHEQNELDDYVENLALVQPYDKEGMGVSKTLSVVFL